MGDLFSLFRSRVTRGGVLVTERNRVQINRKRTPPLWRTSKPRHPAGTMQCRKRACSRWQRRNRLQAGFLHCSPYDSCRYEDDSGSFAWVRLRSVVLRGHRTGQAAHFSFSGSATSITSCKQDRLTPGPVADPAKAGVTKKPPLDNQGAASNHRDLSCPRRLPPPRPPRACSRLMRCAASTCCGLSGPTPSAAAASRRASGKSGVRSGSGK